MPAIGDIVTIVQAEWPKGLDYSGPWRIIATGEAFGAETYTAERIDATPEHAAKGLHRWSGLLARQIGPAPEDTA